MTMSEKPTYGELEQRLKEFENIAAESKQSARYQWSSKMESFPVKAYIWLVHRWLPEIQ